MTKAGAFWDLFINSDGNHRIMWDARFDIIRDRKLNELVIFSAMVRTNPSMRSEYMDIIMKIGKDLEVLDALSAGKPVPKTEPILSPLYRGRLSKYESLDEYVMDQCREVNSEEAIERLGAALRLSAPDRISYPERISAAPEKLRLPSVDRQERLEAPEDSGMIQAPEEPQKIDAPDVQDRIEAPGVQEKLEMPEEKPLVGAAPENDSVFDLLVSIDDAVTLKKVRAMKDGKIDFFIDAEMSGRFKDVACEDVISFLKTDISLIDSILSINITSVNDIEDSIRKIIALVNDAEEPKHQKIYLNALDYNEKDLEAEYNNVLRRFEQNLKERYSYILWDTGSLFFNE